jgi:GNAT superfamily N-acetyltransferase
LGIVFEATTQADAEALVEIRILAMRESLQRISRFDPQRARDRFLAAFEPALCRYIVANGTKAGFVLVRPMVDHLLLDHLYVKPDHQGRGIGLAALRTVMAEADAKSMPIRLGALRGSDSNRFYQRHGFVQTDESEWDIYYVRDPQTVSDVSPP